LVRFRKRLIANTAVIWMVLTALLNAAVVFRSVADPVLLPLQ
jgi:hypothetical protein